MCLATGRLNPTLDGFSRQSQNFEMSREPLDEPQAMLAQSDLNGLVNLPGGDTMADFTSVDAPQGRVTEEGPLTIETSSLPLLRARSRVAGVPRDRSYVDEFLAWRREEALREL